MKQVIARLKNWSLPSKKKWRKGSILVAFALIPLLNWAQSANYVNNGSFEDRYPCTFIPNNLSIAKYWRTIDSIPGNLVYCDTCSPYNTVPYNSGFGFQYPRTGHACVLTTLLCEPPFCSVGNSRAYFRNRLKFNLASGKVYCVKFYVNISNNSVYGIDGFGAYFGDNSLDTISKCTVPLTYLVPQVQNPTNNIITDTLNWILITGTFVATGIEKHIVIGNFKSDTNTNKILIDPTNAQYVYSNVLVDDVSCIAIDLPAYAGRDTFALAVDSIFIGRPPDVGIDEACMWYKLPNTTTPIDTVAGFWVKPSGITSYVVRQEICGNVKWDTVTIYESALDVQNLTTEAQDLKLYPVPAEDELNVQCSLPGRDLIFTKAKVLNNLGQPVMELDLIYRNKKATIDVKALPKGVYVLLIKGDYSTTLSKRFIKN